MADTIGSLVDKISIVELKLYHMREQEERPDVSPEFVTRCKAKSLALYAQREALTHELDALKSNPPKPFPQFKMYNDPQYQEPK
jgi:hypothetical protein